MRSYIFTTLAAALAFTPDTHAFTFFNRNPSISEDKATSPNPLTRKWQRGVAKARPYTHSIASTSGRSTQRVVSDICDTHALPGEFAKCYDVVLEHLGRSDASYCGNVRSGAVAAGCLKERTGREFEDVEGEGKCRDVVGELSGCEAFINDVYAYCLTYSYSDIHHIVDCAAIELGLREDETSSPNQSPPLLDRPLALQAQKRAPVAAPEPQTLILLSSGFDGIYPSTTSQDLFTPVPILASDPASTSTEAIITAEPVVTTSIPYYTNGSIAYLATTATILGGPGPVSLSTTDESTAAATTTDPAAPSTIPIYLSTPIAAPSYTNSSSSIVPTTTASTSSFSLSLGGAGRNGTYSPIGTGTSTGKPYSYSTISYSFYQPSSIPYTGTSAVSSLQDGTIPTPASIITSSSFLLTSSGYPAGNPSDGNRNGTAMNTSGSGTRSASSTTTMVVTGTVQPVQASTPITTGTISLSMGVGNRIGTFTWSGSVCTRYTSVMTLASSMA